MSETAGVEILEVVAPGFARVPGLIVAFSAVPRSRKSGFPIALPVSSSTLPTTSFAAPLLYLLCLSSEMLIRPRADRSRGLNESNLLLCQPVARPWSLMFILMLLRLF